MGIFTGAIFVAMKQWISGTTSWICTWNVFENEDYWLQYNNYFSLILIIFVTVQLWTLWFQTFCWKTSGFYYSIILKSFLTIQISFANTFFNRVSLISHSTDVQSMVSSSQLNSPLGWWLFLHRQEGSLWLAAKLHQGGTNLS